MGDSTAAGSFRRRGSGRSRSSVGATRSRGTKHSTGKLGQVAAVRRQWLLLLMYEVGVSKPGLCFAHFSRFLLFVCLAIRMFAAAAAVSVRASTCWPFPCAEEGTGSADHHKAGAAALDTAASPKPRALKKRRGNTGGAAGRQAHCDLDAGSSSESSDGEGQASGGSDGEGEHQGSGAVGSSERGNPRAGAAAAGAAADPLEAWFKQHYSMLKSAGLLGAGFAPASAETGRPWANGARRRTQQPPTQQQRRKGRPPQQQQQQRRRPVARQAHSSEVRALVPVCLLCGAWATACCYWWWWWWQPPCCLTI